MKPVIEVNNLSKLYRLGVIGSTTLNQTVENWFYTLFGKKDALKRFGTYQKTIDPSDLQAGSEPNTFWALRDLTFSVERGQVVGVIGRNGAGKSTLLKILTRITEPTEGHAILRGWTSSLLEVGTGFHPELTGRENVYLNGSMLGMTRQEITRKFDEIVQFAEMGKFIDTPVKRYSSGMYVRLAFSIAAHLEPDILLVDEVLAVGDLVFRKKCLGKMEDVAKEGRTVLFVSHNMNAIDTLCQSVLVIDKGVMVTYGPTEDGIGTYLKLSKEQTLEQGADVTFEDDQEKSMVIRRVRILDEEENLLEQLDNRKPFITEIEVDIKEYKNGTYLVWLLRGPDYKVLCYSCDNDLTEGKSAIDGNGIYWARVKFPGNVLNGGTYSLELVIVDRMQTHSYDLRKIDLFMVNRHEFGMDKKSGVQRKGQMLIPLKWDIERK